MSAEVEWNSTHCTGGAWSSEGPFPPGEEGRREGQENIRINVDVGRRMLWAQNLNGNALPSKDESRPEFHLPTLT